MPKSPPPATTAGKLPSWAPIVSIASGLIFILLLLGIALFIPQPTPSQFFVIRVVLSLAAAAFGASIPGFIQIRMPLWGKGLVSAGGALGLFVLVYQVNPPDILTKQGQDIPPKIEEKGHEGLMSSLQAPANDLGLPPKAEHTLTALKSSSPWSDSPGSEIAVRFSPKVYPARLKRVRFFITSLAKPWTQFEARLYDADKVGQPGSRLNSISIMGAGGLGEEWIDLDVSQHNIVVTHGDFFVSMVWSTAPGPEGENAQFLGTKPNKVIPGRTFFKFGGDGKWKLENDKNYLIQAIINDDLILQN
ncbi:MAG: hypothetical protein ABSH41_24695 [Syntrophobacteraceae bacterium]